MAGFNRTYAVMIYVALTLVTISQLIFTFLLSFACNPIAKQWDPSIPGSCINTLPTYFALGGTSLAWDVLIIVLPFPILRRLQLTKRNKVRRMSSTSVMVSLVLIKLTGGIMYSIRSRLLRYHCPSDPHPHCRSFGNIHRIKTHHPMVDRGNQHGRHRGMRTRL